jgi:hypothetical protein
MKAQDTDHPILICSRVIPRSWRQLTRLDARARVSAMYLKVGGPRANGRELVFAAPRVGWIPDRVDAGAGIGPDHVFLGDLDMDVSLFDTVRDRNRLPISAAERDCFYELLVTAGKATPSEVSEQSRPLQLGPLLQQPERWHGRLLRVPGNVRRITKVLVDEPDIQQRFGVDHYYQLDVLVPLGNQQIKLQGQAGRPSGPVYRDSFPFTFCALRLPQGWMSLIDRQRVDEPVVMRGFFFKLWSYRSPFVSAHDKGQVQISPMFIIGEPERAPRTSAESPHWGIVGGIGFLCALGLIWFVVWCFHRSDRRVEPLLRRDRFTNDSPSLTHLQDEP